MFSLFADLKFNLRKYEIFGQRTVKDVKSAGWNVLR